METYTVYRQGQFTCTPKGDTHCGLAKDIPVAFRYECWVKTSDLDAKGFGIDNATFQVVLDETEELYESCEQLCYKTSKRLFRECVSAGLGFDNILGVRVRIWGLPAAGWAEYEWNKDDKE